MKSIAAIVGCGAAALGLTFASVAVTVSALVEVVDALTAECFWDECDPSVTVRLIDAALLTPFVIVGLGLSAGAVPLWRATFRRLRHPSPLPLAQRAASSPEESSR